LKILNSSSNPVAKEYDNCQKQEYLNYTNTTHHTPCISI